MKRVAFVLKFPLQSLVNNGNVVGDELYALALAKAVYNVSGIKVDILSIGDLLDKDTDEIIYFNDQFPFLENTKIKQSLYFQNGYNEGSLNKLRSLPLHKFCRIFVLSDFIRSQLGGLIDQNKVFTLKFGSILSPEEEKPSKYPLLHCEVSYLGNNIKGRDKTFEYFKACSKHGFKLFGNWRTPRRSLIKMAVIDYKEFCYYSFLQKFAQGKLPQEKVVSLYQGSQINLNLTMDDCVANDVVSLRTLDILNCGGFLVSDSRSSQLSIGYVAAPSGHNASIVINEFLKRDDLRKEIALEGQAMVKSSMLIEHTAARLCNILSL